jgi:NAD(P)-dependent dehydrogenase (short-subunit alcohol dehydrogenase family)
LLTDAFLSHNQLGPPTILLNNAARPIHALPLLPTLLEPSSANEDDPEFQIDTTKPTLSPTQAQQTLTTNTAAHFNTLSACLPHLLTSPTGGHIVTITSILGPLAPSHLSDYAASKTAALTLHASLQHEIASHANPHVRRNLKTLLVELGQLDTGLFGGAAAPDLPAWARFFGPVVEAKDVVRWITWYLERGEGGVVRLPFWARCVGIWWPVVPGSVQRVVRWASGVDHAVRLR